MDIHQEIGDDAAALKFIEDLTSKCDEVQVQVLAEILSQNAEVEYLNQHGISKGCIDRETFKSKVPLVKYDDLKPYIQRIANGDCSPILCGRPITHFHLSTGTSGGEPRQIPVTADDNPRKHRLYKLLKPLVSQYVQGLESGKVLTFLFINPATKTPGGIMEETSLSTFHKSIYAGDKTHSDPYDKYTGPKEAILCPDIFQSFYTQMLCGLYQRHEVNCVDSHFASILVVAIHFLRDNYSELCHDISSGELNTKISDPKLRAYMIKHIMKPEPELAKFIYQACKGEKWEGIVNKIWPNMKYLEVIATGSMSQHIPNLNYYSGGLPIASLKYTCSEGPFGINLNPLCDPYDVSYTLMPNLAYFEFIPLNSSPSYESLQPSQLVELAKVEVGKEYELVVTTYDGLYRYRIEDVVTPTGFYNSTPQFKFVRRKDVLLSVAIEKTTESELQTGMEKAYDVLRPLDIRVVEYTSYGNVETVPGFYVIYCELSTSDATTTKLPLQDIMGRCCLAIENSLNWYYYLQRVEDGTIGPLEIRVVKNGTFAKMRDYAISRGASLGQFKVPRCIKHKPLLELLNSEVISTHTSPSMPEYSGPRQLM